MARVTIELPTLLHRFADNQPTVMVEADSLRGALRQLTTAYPAFVVHLFNESGELREHVLCFHNDTNTRWMDTPDAPVRDGDRLTIMQAVSGG